MKVYIACGFEHAQDARDLATRLPKGWEWSYDWTGHTFDDSPLGVALRDRAGVRCSDAMIVLLPGGPGTHVEMGIAIGLCLPLCIVGHMPRKDPRWPWCPFYTLGHRAETVDEAVEWLSSLASERERREGGDG